MSVSIPTLLDNLKNAKNDTVLIENARVLERTLNNISGTESTLEERINELTTSASALLDASFACGIKNRRQIIRIFGRACLIKLNDVAADAKVQSFVEDLLRVKVLNDVEADLAREHPEEPLDGASWELVQRMDLLLEAQEVCALFARQESMLWTLVQWNLRLVSLLADALVHRGAAAGGSHSLLEQCQRAVIAFRLLNCFLTKELHRVAPLLLASLDATALPADLMAIMASPDASRDVVTQAGFAFALLARTVAPSTEAFIQLTGRIAAHLAVASAAVVDAAAAQASQQALADCLPPFGAAAARVLAPSEGALNVTLGLSLLRATLILGVDETGASLLRSETRRELVTCLVQMLTASLEDTHALHYILQTVHVWLHRESSAAWSDGVAPTRIVSAVLHALDSQDKLVVSAATETFRALAASLPSEGAVLEEVCRVVRQACAMDSASASSLGITTSPRTRCLVLTNLADALGAQRVLALFPSVTALCLESLVVPGTTSVASSLLNALLGKTGQNPALLEEVVNFCVGCTAAVTAQVLPILARSIPDVLTTLLQRIAAAHPANVDPCKVEFRPSEVALLTFARQQGFALWVNRPAAAGQLAGWQLEVHPESLTAAAKKSKAQQKALAKQDPEAASKAALEAPSVPVYSAAVYRVSLARFSLGLLHPSSTLAAQVLTCAVTSQQSGLLPLEPELALMREAILDRSRAALPDWRSVVASCLKKTLIRVREGGGKLLLIDQHRLHQLVFGNEEQLKAIEASDEARGLDAASLRVVLKAIHQLYKACYEGLAPGCPPDVAALYLDTISVMLDFLGPRSKDTSPTDGTPLRGFLVGDVLGFFAAPAQERFQLALRSSWEAAREVGLKGLLLSPSALIPGESVDQNVWLNELKRGAALLTLPKASDYLSGQHVVALAFDALGASSVAKGNDARGCNGLRPAASLVLSTLETTLGGSLLARMAQVHPTLASATPADLLAAADNDATGLTGRAIMVFLLAAACEQRSALVQSGEVSIASEAGAVHGIAGALSACMKAQSASEEMEKGLPSGAAGLEDGLSIWRALLTWLPESLFGICRSTLGLIAEGDHSVLLNPNQHEHNPAAPKEEKTAKKVDCRGHPIPEGEEEDTSGLAVFSWTTVKETGAALEAALALSPLSDAAALKDLGVRVLNFLLATRHPGAMDRLFASLSTLARRLTLSGVPALCAVPHHWLRSILHLLSLHTEEAPMMTEEEDISTLALPPPVRRSQALGLAFSALLRAEPSRMRASLMPLAMNRLMAILESAAEGEANEGTSERTLVAASIEAVVHATHIIRAVIRDSQLAAATLPYLATVAVLSMKRLGHSQWPVRNAANLLMATCMRRLFATDRDSKVSRAKGFAFASGAESRTGPKGSTVTLDALTERANELPFVLLRLLKADEDALALQADTVEEQQVAALLFLIRAGPSAKALLHVAELPSLPSAAPAFTGAPELGAEVLGHVMQRVVKALGSASFFVRSFASRVLANCCVALPSSWAAVGLTKGQTIAVIRAANGEVAAGSEILFAITDLLKGCAAASDIQLAHGLAMAALETAMHADVKALCAAALQTAPLAGGLSILENLTRQAIVAVSAHLPKARHLVVAAVCQALEALFSLVPLDTASEKARLAAAQLADVVSRDAVTAYRPAEEGAAVADAGLTTLIAASVRLSIYGGVSLPKLAGLREIAALSAGDKDIRLVEQETVRVGRKAVRALFPSAGLKGCPASEELPSPTAVELLRGLSALVADMSARLASLPAPTQYQVVKTAIVILDIAAAARLSGASAVETAVLGGDAEATLTALGASLYPDESAKWHRMSGRRLLAWVKTRLLLKVEETNVHAAEFFATLAQPSEEAIVRLEAAEMLGDAIRLFDGSQDANVRAAVWFATLALLTDERPEVTDEAARHACAAVSPVGLEAHEAYRQVVARLTQQPANARVAALVFARKLRQDTLPLVRGLAATTTTMIYATPGAASKTAKDAVTRMDAFEIEPDNLQLDVPGEVAEWAAAAKGQSAFLEAVKQDALEILGGVDETQTSERFLIGKRARDTVLAMFSN